MSLPRLLVARSLALFRGRRYDRELEDEIQAHLELAERDALAAGRDPAEARREALAQFGSIGAVRDAHRDVRTLAWIENLRQDIRHAARSLRRDRAFTVVAVAVLAAAVGVSAMVFSIADAISLRALPFAEPDRLAAVVEYTPPRQEIGSFAYGHTTSLTYLDWRSEQSVFEGLTAIGGARPIARYPGSESPTMLVGVRVSHEFFPVFRVRPLLGRIFLPEEEDDGNHRVVLLGYDFWVNAFGGSPDAIDQTIELDSEVYRIVGVVPEDFRFRYPVTSPQEAQIFVPLRIRAADRVRGQSRNYSYTIVGRLKQDVDVAVASDSMAAISRGLAEQYPDWWRNRQADVVPLHQHLVGHTAPRMTLLLFAIAGVMVVACVNVANLLLVRSTTRVRDTSMRAALGAPRSRLVRIMMIEGVIIAVSAAVLGLGVAHGLVAQAVVWLPPDLPRLNSVAIDGRVFAVAVAAAVLTSVSFSLGPALSASKPRLERDLRGGSRLAGSRRGERTRAGLLVAEVALATVLVTGASLFVGSLVNWLRTDLGFDSHNLLTFGAPLRPTAQELAAARAKGADAVVALQREFEIRGNAQTRAIGSALSGLPGVESVSVVDGGVPLTGGYSRGPFSLPDRVMPPGVEPYVDYRRVSANHAHVLRLPMREGRYLSADDETSRASVAVVNEIAARAYWPGESALGQQLRLFDTTTVTVVGVMRDIRHLGPEQPTVPEVHIPIDSWASASFVIRTTRSAEGEMPSIRTAVASVNRDQIVIGDVFALESYADRLVAPRRFTMILFVVLGVVGLAIAAAGVYGVMAYTVSQRRQEIGVRMALGARPADVVSMVLGRSVVLIGAGLIIGATCAWYLSSTVESFLFQLSPTDPYIYAAAIATLGVAGLVASIIPARRAAKVDPLIALRAE